jgi:hypothetical protein
MVGVEEDMGSYIVAKSGRGIGYQPSLALDFSTYGIAQVKQDMVVGDKQRRHLTVSIVLPRRTGREKFRGGELKDLKRDLLAICLPTILQNNNAGLTEETDKMIQEELRNCQSWRKRKEMVGRL